ncbi:MAG: P1 family peptidase [Chloroflexota bacterium]
MVLATNAPLLPHQCERLAQRASLGIARMGGIALARLGRPVHRVRHGQPRPVEAAGERDPHITVGAQMVVDRGHPRRCSEPRSRPPRRRSSMRCSLARP